MVTKISHQTSPDRLFAWMLSDPENPRLVGEITRQNNGDVGLTYDPTWFEAGFALSDDMPLIAQTWTPVHHTARRIG